MRRPRHHLGIKALTLAIVLILAACAESNGAALASQPGTSEPPDWSARDIYFAEHEAVATCMLERGFDYRPPAFVDLGDRQGLVGRLELRNAETLGYRGTWAALELLTPGGEPGPDVPWSEYETYASALNGTSTAVHSHDATQGNHSHDVAQDHDHGEFGLGGCYEAGSRAVAEFKAEPAIERDALRRLTASDEYLTFSQSWVECMAQAGLEPRASMPITHGQVAQDHFQQAVAEQIQTVLQQRLAAADFFDSLLERTDTLDAAWFQRATSEDAAIAALFDDEVREATTDRICRANHQPQIAERLLELTRQISTG